MQTSKVDNSTSFGIKFTKNFQNLVSKKAHEIIFRCSKNSKEYKDFNNIIKKLRKINPSDTIDTYNCEFSKKIAIFTMASDKKTQSATRFNNDSNLFSNILNFVMNK